MRLGSRIHRLWLWWNDAYWEIGRWEIALPQGAWRIRCWTRGHEVVDDQCCRPEHRFCLVCAASMPGQPVTSR